MIRLKAQVTPFFAIISILVLALLCGAVESARLAGCRLQTQISASSALTSAFGEYHTQLFDRYGILCFPGNEDVLAGRVQEYLSYYEAPSKGLLQKESLGSWYPFQGEGISWTETELLLDYGGRAFEKQACLALGITLGSDVISKLLEQWDLAEACGKFLEKLRQFQARAEEILGLEKQYQKIKGLLEQVKEQKDFIVSLLEQIGKETEKPAENLKELLLERYGQWEPDLLELFEEGTDYLGECRLLEKTKEYLEELLYQGTQELPELFAGILRENGKAVLDYIAEGGLVRKQIETWKSQAEELLSWKEWFNEDLTLEELTGKKDRLSELFFGDPQEEEQPTEETSNGASFLELAKRWKEEGILALTAEGPFSQREWSGERLPSEEKEESTGETDPITTLIFQEYLFAFFDSYCDGGEGYELEYILGSSPSDLENLKSAAEKLLLLREGLNLAYLYTDQEKRLSAQALAQTLLGVTGLSFLSPVAECLILSAWALGESLGDVKLLLQGEKVPLWKDKSSWNTSVQGLLSGVLPEKGKAEGLSYEGYLRLLLLFQDPVKKRLRALDVIQWNLCQITPGICLTEWVTGARMELSYSASPLFFGGTTAYRMKASAAYSYGEN